ncbi:hypothetical protein CIRG_06965 [Coccidioides immitis RMSCC 2394]|uniref:Uncharacterized protein n=1 Tax=Coccidioides immitis RMSCC 2394 TaxID=404692 RepID=A0A0J6YJK8_COCIT|nr:hypothetical protein CIRG_06965 [Coccidioides immitis RMSCC 2394]
MTLIPLSHDPPKRVPPPNLTFKSCMPLSHTLAQHLIAPSSLNFRANYEEYSMALIYDNMQFTNTDREVSPDLHSTLSWYRNFSTISSPNARPTPSTSIESNTLQLAWEEAIIMPWD